MQIRDRVKEFRRVPASELRPSPRNWRTHPEHQRNVLQGLLAQVGIADVCIAFEAEDGGLELIDGHLRADVMPHQEIPVIVLDVNRAEAYQILRTLDVVPSLAEVDLTRLADLSVEIQFDSAAVEAMIARHNAECGLTLPDFTPVDETEQQRLDEFNPITCPKCGHTWEKE